MSKAWTSKDIPSQSGKRILVTGATSGIGWNTALELARAGAEVTMPARTQAKADDAAARIHAEISQAKLKTAVMDVSSLKSVRVFADQQLTDTRPIDTLVNNAGVMAIPRRTPADEPQRGPIGPERRSVGRREARAIWRSS
jgi:NAD(P)-dependent dehydrogenase (short-subunit alcohol dehydrogenase family)